MDEEQSVTISELQRAARQFLEAGLAYRKMAQKAGIYGAVIWYEDRDHGLVIVSRGDYRDTLLRNIPEVGPVTQFGAADDS